MKSSCSRSPAASSRRVSRARSPCRRGADVSNNCRIFSCRSIVLSSIPEFYSSLATAFVIIDEADISRAPNIQGKFLFGAWQGTGKNRVRNYCSLTGLIHITIYRPRQGRFCVHRFLSPGVFSARSRQVGSREEHRRRTPYGCILPRFHSFSGKELLPFRD